MPLARLLLPQPVGDEGKAADVEDPQGLELTEFRGKPIFVEVHASNVEHFDAAEAADAGRDGLEHVEAQVELADGDDELRGEEDGRKLCHVVVRDVDVLEEHHQLQLIRKLGDVVVAQVKLDNKLMRVIHVRRNISHLTARHDTVSHSLSPVEMHTVDTVHVAVRSNTKVFQVVKSHKLSWQSEELINFNQRSLLMVLGHGMFPSRTFVLYAFTIVLVDPR
mmetsp:Transcript_21374/g.70824  ORF Transcript_21374/g.70824 Transcript_21374/m.70824 type:complete len:221 (-) Transcript_21374:823-1485(-)